MSLKYVDDSKLKYTLSNQINWFFNKLSISMFFLNLFIYMYLFLFLKLLIENSIALHLIIWREKKNGAKSYANANT